MKGNVNINLSTKQMIVEATVASIEDAGAAIDAIKAGARALWPSIVFEGEPGFEEAGEGDSEPRPEPAKPRGGI